MDPEPSRVDRIARAVAIGAATYPLVAGLISFLGWPLAIPRLTAWDGTGISIMPNTCVGIVFAALALLLFQFGYRRPVAVLGTVVATLGVLMILQHALRMDFGFNHQLLFGHHWGQTATVTPGKMGPPASISFTLIGIALLCLVDSGFVRRMRDHKRCVSVVGLIVCSLMFFSLVGYLFGARDFFALPWLSAIALQTSTMFVCLGLALVASVPQRQPMKLLLSDSGAGVMARRALPVLVGLPPFLFWLRAKGVDLGLFDVGTGRALIVLSLVLITVGLMWRTLLVVARQEETERAHHRYVAEELERVAEKRAQQVIHAERALVRSERMAAVGTLASGLAHDINNILMPLGLRTERLLRNPTLDDTARGDMSAVNTLLEHLREMSKNLSLFARDPDQEGTIGWTDLSSWWGGIEGLIASSLYGPRQRKYIRLSGDIPAGLQPVNVAPHRLTQAVLNLVHNARDAILVQAEDGNPGETREGHITIEARANEDMVTIKVIDDGCGMTPEVVRRAVEAFYTTKDRANVVAGSGSGLGLALVSAICERSGGMLEIHSEFGRGTTIAMILPASRDTEAAAANLSTSN